MRALTMSPRPRLMAAEARRSSAAGQVDPSVQRLGGGVQ